MEGLHMPFGYSNLKSARQTVELWATGWIISHFVISEGNGISRVSRVQQYTCPSILIFRLDGQRKHNAIAGAKDERMAFI